eukprot:gene5289-5332_t
MHHENRCERYTLTVGGGPPGWPTKASRLEYFRKRLVDVASRRWADVKPCDLAEAPPGQQIVVVATLVRPPVPPSGEDMTSVLSTASDSQLRYGGWPWAGACPAQACHLLEDGTGTIPAVFGTSVAPQCYLESPPVSCPVAAHGTILDGWFQVDQLAFAGATPRQPLVLSLFDNAASAWLLHLAHEADPNTCRTSLLRAEYFLVGLLWYRASSAAPQAQPGLDSWTTITGLCSL